MRFTMRHETVIAAAALLCAAAATRAAGAQESSVDGHVNYARGTVTHANQWGGGVQYGLTWGSKSKPQLGTSLAADYMKQEKGGPQQLSGSFDAVVQVSAGLFSPYAGGSVAIVRTSGGGLPEATTDPGYQYIVGTLLKLESQSPLSLRFEVRPGYVRGSEHTVTGRFGVTMSL